MTRTPFADWSELRSGLDGVLAIGDDDLDVLDSDRFRREVIDQLVYTAVFGEGDLRDAARWIIRTAAPKLGAFPASIHDLYIASGRGEYDHATAPAINVRGLTYDMTQAILQAAMKNDTKIVLFELARSEMSYTWQRPGEYASSVLAGAIKAGYQGPVFIQGDHYQINAKNYAKDPEGEVQKIKDLAAEAIAAGYYNIDIDASTIVDLDRPTIEEQQERNYVHTAELTQFIREVEPAGVTVSVGAEIGEVGGRNSTVEDLHGFMSGYLAELQRRGGDMGKPITGISKISVQTGTSHGGVVLPDGSIAQVSVDFETLAALSKAAREEYGLGGAVQHGASTLPEEAFNRFAEANAIEVHLATAFQNQLYDSAAFPADLRDRIYAHLAANNADERKPNQTDAQFYYTTRKRGFGPFKRELWDMPEETRQQLMTELGRSFDLIMQRLGVAGKAALVDRIVKPVVVPVPAPEALRGALV
ncbi:MAG: tagatose 1,6-diphosphate aldolase GatY/KbaY [Thermomicrobiales bacterium]|nr:tagatose 1,6-diphosphate aldolase GatY/KbaY [Thermomicrobiales bacterium]